MYPYTRALLAALFALSVFSTALGSGVESEDGMTWRVAYAQDEPHPQTGDHALRLRVNRIGNAGRLTGSLWRYEHTGMGMAQKYTRRPGNAGNIPLNGVVTVAGAEGKRKLERFVLTGFYTDGDQAFQIIINGYHTVGKNPTNRTDDQVCLRIRQKRLKAGMPLAAPAMAVMGTAPCDEEPPDEDVLTEDDEPADPDEEPYDGGD